MNAPQDVNQMNEHVIKLLSPAKNVRDPAEALLTTMFDDRVQRNNVVAWMSQLMVQSGQQEVRSLCALILRRRLNKGEPTIFEKLEEKYQAEYEKALLHGLVSEAKPGIRQTIADSVVDLAYTTVCKGQWQELLPHLQQFTQHQNEHVRGSAIYILGCLSDAAYSFMENHLQTLLGVYQAGLQDNSIAVKVVTLQAMRNHLEAVANVEVAQAFVPLLPKVLETVTLSMQQADDEFRQTEVMQALNAFAEEQPALVGSALDKFVTLTTQIGDAKNLPESVRALALEFLVSFADNDEVAARKSDLFVKHACELTLKQMLDIEEVTLEEWQTEEDDVIDERDLFSKAETSCDRLSLALGAKRMFPCIFPIIEQFLQSNKWHYRYVALRALAQLAESAVLTGQTENDVMNTLISIPLRCCSDPDPRVRYAAVHCLGQMSTDFAPTIQENHHAAVVPAITALLSDPKHPKVQSHAAAALVNYAEYLEEHTISPYTQELLPALHKLLQSGERTVQEHVATAVASIADSAAVVLIPVLEPFLKVLLEITMKFHENPSENEDLATRCLECISFIGSGLCTLKPSRADLMVNVAHELMKVTTKGLDSENHPMWYQYSMQSWVRFAQVLGDDFKPYLPLVMPTILKSCSLKCTLEEGDDHISNEDGYHAGEVEEKSFAVSALSSLPSHFADCESLAFLPYLEASFNVFVPLVDSPITEVFRRCGLLGLPNIMRLAMLAVKANKLQSDVASKLLKLSIESILKELSLEIDDKTRLLGLDQLRKLIETAGDISRAFFAVHNNALEVVKTCGSVHGRSQRRRGNMYAQASIQDQDEEANMRMAAEFVVEDQLDVRLSKTVELIIRTAGENFGPVFTAVASDMLKLLNSEKEYEKKYPLNFFADCIEIIPQVAPVRDSFHGIVPIILKLADAQDPGLAQSAVFAIGSSAKAAPDLFSQYSKPALEVLSRACEKYRNESPTKLFAVFDNAVGALSKLLQYHGNSINVAQVFPQFLQLLPLRKDMEEAVHINGFLCTLLEQSDQPQSKAMLGDNMASLVPRILLLLADSLGTDAVDEEVTKRVVQIFKMLPNLPENVRGAFLGALSPQTKEKLRQIGV